MATVLGIDPSLTSTGYAVISESEPRVMGLITSSASARLGYRLSNLSLSIKGIIKAHTPMLVVVERSFSGGQGPSAIKLGTALGAVLVGIIEAFDVVMGQREAYLVAPKVRAKYATGNGNAAKAEVLTSAVRRLNYDGCSDDEADALWLAWVAAEAAEELWGFKPYEPWPKMPDASYDAVEGKVKTWEQVG